MIVAFEKTARVRYIGHLDLLRAMQRALRRSGLPIRYSQGFNPHVVLAFASPLAVGISGEEELMDVALEEPVAERDFTDRLCEALPSSLPLVAVRPVEDRQPALMAQLRTAAYDATFANTPDAQALVDTIEAFLARDEIIAIRKTKSGEKPCDIRPMVHELCVPATKDQVLIQFRVSLTERETLKPDLLLRTLAEQAGIPLPAVRIHRTRLFGERDNIPVPLMEI